MTSRNNRFSTGIIIEEVHDMEPRDFKFLHGFLKNLYAKGLKEPLIITCRGELDKRFKTLSKSNALYIHLDTITGRDIHITYRRLKQLHRLSVSDELLHQLANKAQRDYFQAIMLLETTAKISRDAGKSRIDNDDMTEALGVLCNKRGDLALTELVKQVLFNSKASFDDIYKIAETETIFLPQVVHENFIQVLDKNVNADVDTKLAILADYYDCLLSSQLFHEKSFGHWYLLDYVSIFGSVAPHVLLKSASVRDKPGIHNETSSTLSHYGHQGANMKSLNHVILITGWSINTINAYSHLLWNTMLNSTEKFEECIKYITNLYPELTEGDIERIMKQPIFLNKKYKSHHIDIEWADYDKVAKSVVSRWAKDDDPYQA
jgi:hypothetical protein